MSDKNVREIIYDSRLKIKEIFNFYGNIILIIFASIILLIAFSIFNYFSSGYKLTVRFLDIGQGDAILITMPDKKQVLIDAGPDDKVVRKIENYFSVFNRSIDLAIFTHSDADHIGGFYYVLKKYDIKNILQNGDTGSDSAVFEETQDKIKNEIENSGAKSIIANCGDKISFGDNPKVPRNADLYIFHPVARHLSTNDTNSNSIVSLLVYGRYGFLFTGDMDKEMEKRLDFEIRQCFSKEDQDLIQSKMRNITVLKVAHHGSDTSSGEEFIKDLKPVYSIISAGKNNRYGHPREETIKILEKYSKNILSTIESGDIVFTTDGVNLEVKK